MTDKLHLSTQAQQVLEHFVLRRNEEGRVTETPEQVFRRVARLAASSEVKYGNKSKIERLLRRYGKSNYDFWWLAVKAKEFSSLAKQDKHVKQVEDSFYELLSSLEFVPDLPVLMNAGRRSPQLASVYIFPIEDSLDSIFGALRKAALVHQTGAATGFSFRKVRPHGDHALSSDRLASGPLSFIRLFDRALEQVAAGNKRCCATLSALPLTHPEVMPFVTAQQFDELHHTNRAVLLSDHVLQAAERGTSVSFVNPRTGKAMGREDARALLQMLGTAALAHAEPGILFSDEINRNNPTPKLGSIEASGPGGEALLLPNEACTLGSINAGAFVQNEQIDWQRLKKRVGQAVHFLDNLIDVTDYLFPEVFAAVHGNRKLALGVMGFADLLAQMKVRYNTDRALQIAEELMRFIAAEAKQASAELAVSRGVYPNFRKGGISSRKKEDQVRNAARTAIAPASTISLIAECSPGIEPFFALAYRQRIGPHDLQMVNRHFVAAAKKEEIYSDKLQQQLLERGHSKGLFIPVWMKRVYVTAADVGADWHVRMQAAFQKYCDQGVAKLVMLRDDTTVDEVLQLIRQAHASHCKGLTLYPAGSARRHHPHGEAPFTAGAACPRCVAGGVAGMPFLPDDVR